MIDNVDNTDNLSIESKFDPFLLNVVDLNLKKYPIYCYGLGHTIEYIKFVLSTMYKIDTDVIDLLLNGKELKDYKTFYESGVTKDSTVIFLIRLSSGFNIVR